MAQKGEALNNLPSKDEKMPTSLRPASKVFYRQPRGNVCEMQWSAYGLFSSTWLPPWPELNVKPKAFCIKVKTAIPWQPGSRSSVSGCRWCCKSGAGSAGRGSGSTGTGSPGQRETLCSLPAVTMTVFWLKYRNKWLFHLNFNCEYICSWSTEHFFPLQHKLRKQQKMMTRKWVGECYV